MLMFMNVYYLLCAELKLRSFGVCGGVCVDVWSSVWGEAEAVQDSGPCRREG